MAAHYGMLRDYRFSGDVDDIRGSALYGADDEKLGKIDDVIFDHASGTIQYAVVDTGGWLSSKKFLVPADRIRPYTRNSEDFAINATKQQIEALPPYDENATSTDAQWNEHDTRQRKAWGSGPVMHKEGSTHSITPEASEMPAGTGSGVDDETYMPDRLVGKFPDASLIPARFACGLRDSRQRRRMGASRARTKARKFRRWLPRKPKLASHGIQCRRSAITSRIPTTFMFPSVTGRSVGRRLRIICARIVWTSPPTAAAAGRHAIASHKLHH